MLIESLKEQLALAVRSTQWSYGIFWSPSDSQPWVLEWGEGYYNGDIKTIKTVHSSEFNGSRAGLQRSEQLRELYEHLSAGEATQHAMRPAAALCPEDLSDAEWYYLVCMSFVFDIGRGVDSLPGRTLASGHAIWLSNAHCADNKVFDRYLLAKNASIQTVICFPFLRGVIELGVTELVLEDPNLIQRVKTIMVEIPSAGLGKNYSSKDDICLPFADFDNEIVGAELAGAADCNQMVTASPNNRSKSQSVEGRNGGTLIAQEWQFIYDEFSDCALHSANFSKCKSQMVRELGVKEGNHSKQTAMHLQCDDLHYQDVISSPLNIFPPLILSLNSQKDSSFISWKKIESMHYQDRSQQKLLKKILVEVPLMHGSGLSKSPDDDSNEIGGWRGKVHGITLNRTMLERERREKLNKRFMILKSIVPSADKVSILGKTIAYLQELQRRIEELEKRRVETEFNAESKLDHQAKCLWTNKRKAVDIEQDIEDVPKDNAINVSASHTDIDILIEIKCQWREGILLEILNTISHFQLDACSIQASNIDGILSAEVKSKNKNINAASSATTIKYALQRVAWRH